MTKNIALLLGGDSSEYVISEKSAQEIFKFLKKTKFTKHILVWVIIQPFYRLLFNVTF